MKNISNWTYKDYDTAYNKRFTAFNTAEKGQYHISKQFRMQIIMNLLSMHPLRGKMLDVGCGSAMYYNDLLTGPSAPSYIIGIDFSSKALSIAKSNTGTTQVVDFAQADARCLPFDNNTFQFISAFELLEHIWEDNLAVKEFYRVLCPGGYVIASVPNSKHFPIGPFWFENTVRGSIAIDEQVGHVRRYSKDTLISLFDTAGFLTENNLPYFHFFAAYIKLLNDSLILKTPARHAWLYQKILFPSALYLCTLETNLLSGVYCSYGLLIIASKPKE